MNKTEVYSWRVSPDLKQRLEEAARSAGKSVGRVLDEAAEAWLARRGDAKDDEAEQRRLRDGFRRHIGTIPSGDKHGSRDVERRVGEMIRAKVERQLRRGPSRID